MGVKNDDFVPMKDEWNLPVFISKDEMNLAEFPFTLLSRRAKPGQKTIEVNQRVRDQNGKVIDQVWLVTGSDKYGLPLAIDEDVYIALMQLYKKDGFRSREVHFSRYQILRIMGQETSKKGYERIEKSLNRLVSVTIVSKNAFWDNNAKRYVSEAFHLFDGYRLYDERFSEENEQSSPLSNVVMSEFLFESIKAGYIKNLDIGFYFSLETPLSRRLYRYLDKKRYHRRKFEIGILKLATLLPIEDRHPSQIKRRLDRSHNELMEKNFLESFSYTESGGRAEEKVNYVFSQDPLVSEWQKDAGGIIVGGSIETESIEEELVLKKLLIERGISERATSELIKNYPAQQIRKEIETFDWLKKKKSPLLGRNPAGFLRRSIEENYQPPEEYQIHMERETRKREKEKIAIQKQTDEDELEKELARIRAYKEGLSHEERAKLREEAESEIRSSGQYKNEFITEYLIQAKENELIAKRLGIDLPE